MLFQMEPGLEWSSAGTMDRGHLGYPPHPSILCPYTVSSSPPCPCHLVGAISLPGAVPAWGPLL